MEDQSQELAGFLRNRTGAIGFGTGYAEVLEVFAEGNEGAEDLLEAWLADRIKWGAKNSRAQESAAAHTKTIRLAARDIVGPYLFAQLVIFAAHAFEMSSDIAGAKQAMLSEVERLFTDEASAQFRHRVAFGLMIDIDPGFRLERGGGRVFTNEPCVVTAQCLSLLQPVRNTLLILVEEFFGSAPESQSRPAAVQSYREKEKTVNRLRIEEFLKQVYELSGKPTTKTEFWRTVTRNKDRTAFQAWQRGETGKCGQATWDVIERALMDGPKAFIERLANRKKE